MAKTSFSKWRKLDNAALAFPAVTGKRDNRVFRFYCQLKEPIDGLLLQEALDQTMELFPVFQAVLRKGLFWFYLEHREIRALAKEEQRPPCSRIYIPDEKCLLFEVTWRGNRINLEVFHALTDGTGAMNFMEELVKNYLVLAHPDSNLPDIPKEKDVTGSDMEEDSFSQYYSGNAKRYKIRRKPAYQIHGEKLEPDELHIMEVTLPVKETLKQTREHGVSITVLFTALLLFSINEERPYYKMKKPIGLMIPVNLRNYFSSSSMANFFGWIEVSYQFQEDTTMDEVIESVKEQFERELSKEQIGARLNGLVSLERNPFCRIVPLEIKRFFLQAGTSLGGRSITGIYSNVGILHLPDGYEKYIERFGVFASTDSLQLSSCSYEDDLVLSFTSKMVNDNIQRNFLRHLQEYSIPYSEEESNYTAPEKPLVRPWKKTYQIFSFACIAVAIICGMIDFMVTRSLSWSLFVCAGCSCTWLIVSVALRKRRNLLKNGMWQLTIISIIGILWDVFTGWQGWSVNFLLPLASLTVLCSMPVIMKLCHLSMSEYMIYLIQAGLFGWIPLILVFTGTVTTPYPSIICTGISLLFLSALFLFYHKDVLEELQRKFRL